MNNDVDPREEEDFRPELFPLCDGRPAPPFSSTDKVERRMVAFAAAYYRINLCFEKLHEARESDDEATIVKALHDLENATELRDGLENSLEPEGFYAEQELEKLRTVNLEFCHALKSEFQQAAAATSSSFELTVPLPPPPGVTVAEHLKNHLGKLAELSESGDSE